MLFNTVVFLGCSSKTIEKKLETIRTKNDEPIVKRKTFPYASFEEVWDAAILVLMQEGVIVKASKDTGVINVSANPAFQISIDKGDAICIHIDNGVMAKSIFNKVANQIYAKGKWEYLYK